MDEEIEHIIGLRKNKDRTAPTVVGCTCDWTFQSTNILDLGREAKRHSVETGHKLRGT